ncbi:phytanoyl-CoA dioxygenase family protein [Streptomyces sp. URMC 124]|uniref:phytanoyl-CoA dioxygenase family protein n=1 Tax=Streptomyces sp. URMC 124 TaxID=3423405 RepID=UPI003F1E051B
MSGPSAGPPPGAAAGPAALHTVEPGPYGIPVSLRHVLDGALVAVKGGLCHVGALGTIRRETARAVAAALPAAEASRVSGALENAHHHADTSQIAAVRTDLETRLRPFSRTVLHDVARALEPQGARLYLSGHLGIRIMPPERTVAAGGADREEELSGLEGFLTPRDAHIDSWFNTAVNSVNLWMAVGPVRSGNGLLFYPEAYRRPLRHDGHTLVPGQRTGAPVDVELEPGDILLFAGDHLHASQPNSTDQTRFVITKRLCVGPPRYPSRATGWVPYEDPRLWGTRWERWATWRSRLTPGGVGDVLRTARRGLPGAR